MSSRSRRPLSREDVELWSHVTRGVKRLKRPIRKIAAAPVAAVPPPAPPAPTAKTKARPAPVAVAAPPLAAKVASKPAHKPLTAMEPKARRKLNRGKSEVEARIDLHGMRQHEAHAALRRFLAHAHASDMRLVLVITGKGKAAADGAFSIEREVGVLRRMTPHWLGEPDLRHIVLGYESATARHGGEGAIYVRLRRAD